MTELLQRSLLAVLALFGAATGAAAQDDQRPYCPPATPQNSSVLFAPHNRPEDEKAHLATLATSLAKTPRPVCILAFVDSHDAGYSKKLAIKRLIWVKDGLLANGVPPNLIAAELRLAEPDQDKASIRLVTVVLGR